MEISVEKWQLRNLGTTWSHPIHIHLIDFQVVSRIGPRRESYFVGRANTICYCDANILCEAVEPYEAVALKDVIYLGMEETLEVVANYQPWAGVYMFHCHNLQHEDNGMMGAFNVSEVDLSSFGYPDNATFTDPLAGIWRSKPITASTSAQDVQNNLLPMFLGLGAYVEIL